MNLLRFIPIKLTFLLVLGILIGHHFDTGIIIPLLITIVFLISLGLIFYKDKSKTTHRFGIVFASAALSIGVLAVALANHENYAEHYANQEFTGNSIGQLKIREVLKPTDFSDRYVAHIQSLENKSASGKVLLSFPLDSTTHKFNVDDELTVSGNFDEINPPLNPHQFDYKTYLKGLGISHQFRLNTRKFFLKEHPSPTIYGIAASVRNKIIAKLEQANFGTEELGIIQALLLGQRNDISAETYNNYKNAGAVHILAVSGLHIGILLLLLQFLLRPLERLPKGKTLKLIAIVALLWGFALLAGLSASVVRAVTMFSFVAYALYLNRPSNTFNILALSMFFILLVIDPNLLFQVGFQMSYAAVLAIVWVYPILQKLWYPKNKILRYFWQLFSVSIAAQMGVLPISLFYFHQFPGLFFISNLLIIPALGVILGMGILVIFLSLLNRLPDFLVSVYDTLIQLMNSIIAWVAEQETFVFRNISFDAIQLLLAYGILIGLVLFLSKPNFKKAVSLALVTIGFQLWSFYTNYRTDQKVALFLAHQTRNSVLIHQNGNNLEVNAQDGERLKRMVTDYQVAERIASVSYLPVRNSYRWHDSSILIIDSLSIYPEKNSDFDYLVLTQSPKLNLERLLDETTPRIIIADGSNYRSYINRWAATCKKRKLPFHSTGEKGAYYFEK